MSTTTGSRYQHTACTSVEPTVSDDDRVHVSRTNTDIVISNVTVSTSIIVANSNRMTMTTETSKLGKERAISSLSSTDVMTAYCSQELNIVEQSQSQGQQNVTSQTTLPPIYKVIHEECHLFRELICDVMLMKKFHMNMGPIFNITGDMRSTIFEIELR